MNKTLVSTACLLLTCAGTAQAQSATQTVVVTGLRSQRVSAGATGLPLAIKDTPQTISLIEQADMAAFGTTGSNQALQLGTGVNVEQYETNRAVFNARGFEIQLTQIDGLGMTNDYGTVVGQLDTYLFDRIELIRGANGLLTGVGNASGTINYVRKRPTNVDAGELQLSAGSYGLRRAAMDVNRVLADDGAWAGRLVVAHEDADAYLRALHDRRTSVYGVVDGQIGTDGVLTVGLTYQDARQRSPMWGSLTLNHADGSLADFDVSSSTSQDWTFWDTRSLNAFVEYSHQLGADWTLKLTANHRRGEEEVRLLYAYSPTGSLNDDNTGLIGWPYGSFVVTENNLVDLNLSGQFNAWGRRHELIAGLSHSKQTTATDVFAYDNATYQFLPLPAFPYAGDVYPEPDWQPRSPSSDGEQALTRLYAAGRLAMTERLKAIVGVNAVRLQRAGSSRYGAVVDAVDYPDTEELSPYLGLTYDLTPDVLAYASYSDIFQNQDQTDIDGDYLDPMKGVNREVGVKAEWLGKQLLTTMALFTAEQKGLATYAGINANQQYYYEPKDVDSRGIELEAVGRVGTHGKLAMGWTRLQLTGPDGQDIYEWVPRTTFKLRYDTALPIWTPLRLGVAGRWQSDVSKAGGAYQDAYFVADAFVSYALTPHATLRLNVDNLFDRKYVQGLAYGAIYGAPRHGALTLSVAL